MKKKIAGWILLASGLFVIFWGMYESYSIFTGQKEAPEIFSFEEVKTPIQQGEMSQEEAVQKMIGEELKKFLPSDFISEILNLAAWSIFAMIVFFGGGKVSEIGIKIIGS